MALAGMDTDRAPSNRKPVKPAKMALTKPEIPFNNLILNLAMTIAGALVLETFVVLTAGQIIVGLLCKSFNMWLEMGAPGAY